MKKGIIALLVLAGTLFLAGCGSERETNELAYRQYGINCLEAGKYEDAVSAFQKALDQSLGKISDTEVDICLYKARAQYLSGDTDGAIDTYTALIDYNGNADACYLRGSLYYSLGNTGQGAKDFQSAVESEPKDYELYIGIYEVLASYGEDGSSYLTDALAIGGSDGESLMQQGRIYALLGEYEKAAELLAKAVSEGLLEANYYLSEVYTATGDSSASDACFEAYLSGGGADSEELCEIGMKKLESGEYARAIRCFEAALAMDEITNEQTLMKYLIIAYEQNGDFSSAKEWMETYAKEYPDDESMEQEQIFLETR